MILNELTSIPPEALPVTAFREALHLGSGFADDGAQDSVLESYLRAALAMIEARTGQALLERRFSLTLTRWAPGERQVLPIAPVSAIELVRVVYASGNEILASAGSYALEPDRLAPALTGKGALPYLPDGGKAVVELTAGYGPDWGDLPADLAQAALQLAVHLYERRGGPEGSGGMPAGVLAMLEPYRRARLGGGAA